MKKQKGITLIALVITIVVLLILAAVSITALTDEDKGVVTKAKQAATKSEEAVEEENQEIKNILEYGESENWGEELPPPEDVTASISNYVIVNPCNNSVVKDLFGNVGYSTFVRNQGSYPVTILASELNSPTVSFMVKEGADEFREVDFYLWTNNTVNGNSTTSMSLGGSYTNFVLDLEADKEYTILVKLQEANGAIKYCTYETCIVTFSYKNASGVSTLSKYNVVKGESIATTEAPSVATYTSGTTTYTFNKWVTTSGGTTTASLNNIANSKTIYAKYTQTVNESVCFVAGTEVLTENGLVNIEDIKVGMKVYSYNEETEQVELKEVRNTFINVGKKDMVKTTVNGEIIESTSRHEFYVVGKGWMPAFKLEKGDILLNNEGEEVFVENVELIISEGNEVTVYNMEVTDNHNYFVGEEGILVHNASSPC